MRPAKRILRDAGVLLDELFGFIPGAAVSEGRLRRKILRLCELGSTDEDKRTDVSINVIREYHRHEIDRQKAIEIKARDNLLAITIAFSIMSVGIGLLLAPSEGSKPIHFPSATYAVMLVVGVLFLFAAGLAALRALDIGMLYVLDLTDEAELNEERKKLRLVRCLELNQLSTTIKSNYTCASNHCIRNAVVTLFALFILIAAGRM